MGHLQIVMLRAAKLETDPFEYVVVPAFLNAASLKRINTTFPAIAKGGSYPIGSLDSSLVINEVIDELDGPEFERAIAEKFGIDLTGKPKTRMVKSIPTARIRSSPCCSISMRAGRTRGAGSGSCAAGQTSKIS